MAYSPLQNAINDAVKATLARTAKKENRKLNRMAKRVRAVERALAEQKKLLQMQANGRRAGAGPAAEADKRLGRAIDPTALRAFREQLGMSRQQFGRLIGSSASSIFGWEAGSWRPLGQAAEKLLAVQKLGVQGVMKRLLAGWRPPKKLGRPARAVGAATTKRVVVAQAARAARGAR